MLKIYDNNSPKSFQILKKKKKNLRRGQTSSHLILIELTWDPLDRTTKNKRYGYEHPHHKNHEPWCIVAPLFHTRNSEHFSVISYSQIINYLVNYYILISIKTLTILEKPKPNRNRQISNLTALKTHLNFFPETEIWIIKYQ